MMKAPRRLWVLALLSLVGFVLSLWQSNQFYSIRNGTAGFKSICDISATMNCNAVIASKFAEFAAGFPLSSFVAAWMLATLVIAIIARNPYWRRDAVRVLFGMTAFGTVMSLVYLSIMTFTLKVYCLFCLLVDAANIGSFAIVLSLKPEGLGANPLDKGRLKALLGTVLASVVVVVPMLSIILNSMSIPDADAERVAQKILTSAPLAVRDGPEFPSMGAKDAAVTVVEFSDFQCPFCRLTAVNLRNLENRFPGKVRVVFRNYPLDAACNANLPRSMHPYACEAARVGHCAFTEGKFEEAYANIFENQEKFALGVPAQLAEQAGVDRAKLDACVADSATSTAITRDIEEAHQLGVESTPTLFFNGHKIEGGLRLPILERVVEGLLAKAPATAQK